MSKSKSVFCLANNEDHAQRIVDHLLSSGFSNQDVSILFPTHNLRNSVTTQQVERRDFTDRDVAPKEVVAKEEYVETIDYGRNKKGELNFEKHTKAPEGGVTGATAGGIIGGSIGLLAGIGALAIPGLGPFIAAGPIMAALSGLGLGGGLGLIIGTLVGSSIPEYEAKKYEEGLLAGNVLISVHTDTHELVDRACEIMKNDGAKDISCTCEKCKSSL